MLQELVWSEVLLWQEGEKQAARARSIMRVEHVGRFQIEAPMKM